MIALNPHTALHISEGGHIERVTPANGSDFALEEVQKLVDGYIEIVYLKNDWIMIVNEEGKYTKGENYSATLLAHMHGAIGAHDYICGDVVLCESEMLK